MSHHCGYHDHQNQRDADSCRIEQAIEKLRTDLAWRGPSGRVMGHIVIERPLAEAVLAALVGERCWQPMETADKDLPVKLLWDPYFGMKCGRFDALKDKWVTDGPYDWEVGGAEIELDPTHWQPLPVPPSVTGGDEGLPTADDVRGILGTSANWRSVMSVIGAMAESDWAEDCQRYWGRLLTGERAHWCPDWDFLPIDETTKTEIDCCTCTNEQSATKGLKDG